MHFIDELRWRGLLQDITNEDQIRKLESDVSFYVGFDPSAPSLQIGNLVPVILSLHIARGGLKPIMLVGGATGAIGDPSGKSNERNLLEKEEVRQNVRNVRGQLENLFSQIDAQPEFVNNYDWTHQMTFLDFLREVGKYFSVNYMLAKEVVKTRVEGAGISFTEFSYMLLQAHDFLHLYQTRNCQLQICGSDQWGNVTAGCELIRKKISKEGYALCAPLVTDSEGRKFGKSEGGAIWLDPEMTSPYAFHQFWINIPDSDVIKMLKIFTFLSKEEIQEIEAEHQKAPENRVAQKRLADEITAFVHGADALSQAQQGAKALFEKGIENLKEDDLLQVLGDVPSGDFSRNEVETMTVIDLLSETSLVESRGEAKRLIAGGGAYISETKLQDPGQSIKDFLKKDQSILVARSGKKKYFLIRLQ